MTRFDAADRAARRTLFADAVTAHRRRASPFLTIEVDEAVLEAEDGPDPDLGPPWVQFGDGVVNLDCTDEELEQLKAVLEEFPAFTIDEITRPEGDANGDGATGDAENGGGNNVRVSALADPNRIAQFLDSALEETYGLPADYRAWVAEV